jgi:hypothetical protein
VTAPSALVGTISTKSHAKNRGGRELRRMGVAIYPTLLSIQRRPGPRGQFLVSRAGINGLSTLVPERSARTALLPSREYPLIEGRGSAGHVLSTRGVAAILLRPGRVVKDCSGVPQGSVIVGHKGAVGRGRCDGRGPDWARSTFVISLVLSGTRCWATTTASRCDGELARRSHPVRRPQSRQATCWEQNSRYVPVKGSRTMNAPQSNRPKPRTVSRVRRVQCP